MERRKRRKFSDEFKREAVRLCDQGDRSCSMSRKGDCWDNAVAESFFATIKTELLHRNAWPTRPDARHAIADYIEAFYNPHRRHSYLGQLSPAEYERRYASRATQAA